MPSLLIAAVIVAAIVAILMLAVLFRYVSLWFQTVIAGCPVPFMSLIHMRLLRIDPHLIAVAYINARNAGLDLTVDQLQVHALAGGRVMNVVKAMVIATNAGMQLDWEEAAAFDLAGHDIEAEIRNIANADHRA